MGFIPHCYKNGAPYPWEYITASAIGTVVEGMALSVADGLLIKASETVAPKYISMYRGEVANGDVIPVLHVDGAVTFETTFAVDSSDVDVGNKVTIADDGLQVTATTTDGVAEIVSKLGDNDAAGERVLVRFS